MGRKKKYFTEKEQKEAQQKWVREYYERNKEDLNKKAKEGYYERKKIESSNIQDNKLN
jgi:hypothetical protein